MPQLEQALAPLVSGKRILHVGCVGTLGDDEAANFRMHRFLQRTTAEVDGVDNHAEGVARMRALGFTVTEADAETFRSERTYDAVLVLSVLQFVPSPLRVLQNLADCLEPGGACIVSVPNAFGGARLLRELLKFGQPKPVQLSGQSEFGETTLFASHTLAGLLDAAGYQPQRIFRCHSKPAWAGASLRERSYNLRAYLPGLILPPLLPTLVGVAARRAA